MKTNITTLIASVALLLSTTTISLAANKTGNDIVALAEVGNISKIEASGNVEIYITSGSKDGVTVYDNYYGQNAMVQNDNGVLRIASYKNEKLVVLVTVTDLRAITANDNASIKSEGNFSALELEVNLNDNATAQLNVDAMEAKFAVNDNAKADLSGMIMDYELSYSQASTVNRTHLTADNRIETKIALPQPARKHFRMFNTLASL